MRLGGGHSAESFHADSEREGENRRALPFPKRCGGSLWKGNDSTRTGPRSRAETFSVSGCRTKSQAVSRVNLALHSCVDRCMSDALSTALGTSADVLDDARTLLSRPAWEARVVGAEQVRQIAEVRIREIIQSDPVILELHAERNSILSTTTSDRFQVMEQRVAELGAEYLVDVFWKHGVGHSYAAARPDSRVMGLQIIETRIATLMGLSPMPILLGVNLGAQAAFDRSENLVLFDLDAVEHNEPEEVLSSLFHEQTHRIQQEAIRDPRAFPQYGERQIGSWEDNLRRGEYRVGSELPSDRFAYSWQPVERHAEERARALMEIVRGYLTNQLGTRYR